MATDRRLELDPQGVSPFHAEEGLSDAQREAGMRWITWDGILANTMSVLTGGVFLTGFALMLGASETAIGLLSGLPRLSALMQPVGSFFVERLRMRKHLSIWVFGPARLLWAPVILLPIFGYTGGASSAALALVMAVAVISSLLAGLAAVSWLAWMADLIPQQRRGVFFGQRTMLAGGVSALAGYLAGKFIDAWECHHGSADPGGFLGVFAVGLICGIASWYALVRCPEPPLQNGSGGASVPRFGTMLRQAWGDSNFRRFVLFAAVVSSGVWIAGPFFSVYMIKVMRLPYSVMGFLTAANSVGSLAMVRLWGRLSDHFGSRPVIRMCINGASLVPLFYVLTAGGEWWPLLVCMLVGGAAWSGYFLGQMNLVFKITPEEHKSVYIGLFYALEALPTLLAPLLGGLFLQSTADLEIHAGTWTFNNYHLLFLASSLTRFAAVPIFRGVHEPRARSVRHMIRVLSHVRSLNPVLGLHYYGHLVSDAAVRRARRARRMARRAVSAIRRTSRKLRTLARSVDNDP